jgi:phosphoribosylformylglycinamidine cyclo-ligase
VLSPTRTYAPIVREVLQSLRPQVHGMVHCSGGAQTKVLHFVENVHVIKDNLFPVPPLFEMIQTESATPWAEMYKVFNMGHRFEFYVPEAIAGQIIGIAQSFGVEAQVVGRVEAAAERKLTIQSEHGTFSY